MGYPADKETLTPAETPAPENRPGRVVVDARGRNVWQWARNAIDSTSILLKRLENKDLALEPTQKVPVMRGANPQAANKAPATKQAAPTKPGSKPSDGRAVQKGAKHGDPTRRPPRGGTGGGFDPYNSR
ncbi:MAG: hypothetical protein ABI640_11925 [Gammaproteobacteria bacterium]